MGPRGVPGVAGGGGRRGEILEKQKIKMSKMAATLAIFGILIFCFSKTGTKLPGPIGLATSGVQRSIFPTLAGYSLMKMGYRDRWGEVPWYYKNARGKSLDF